MKSEIEIKQKIYDLQMLATSTYEEHHIKQTEIDILEWVLSEEQKFKIGDKVVYRNDGCEFLGEIVNIQNKICKVVFVNCVIDLLDINEVNLELFNDKRYCNFKNI
jgi:hypothetical protein